jgi:hypothetical protein
VNVTSAIISDNNPLEISVANLRIKRLIGDLQRFRKTAGAD